MDRVSSGLSPKAGFGAVSVGLASSAARKFVS